MQQYPKLIKVESRQHATGRTQYFGHFENGKVKLIRTSFRRYGSVAQLLPTTYSQGHPHYVKEGEPVGELVFSARQSPPLTSRQQANLINVCLVLQEAKPGRCQKCGTETEVLTPVGGRWLCMSCIANS